MNNIFMAMGSDSDWKVMKQAQLILKDFDVEVTAKVVSAHRTPDLLSVFAKEAEDAQAACIIAAAGGAAHLPGMLAAFTFLPVIGVPIKATHLDGLDSLLSIVQMPKGVPVATVGINNAQNAAILALKILANQNKDVQEKLIEFSQQQRSMSIEKNNNMS